jgi:starvation-inducible outer membrane lipoprotein
MKRLAQSLIIILVSLALSGCATTDSGVSEKDKEKITRERERANQKEAQSQSKMMKEMSQPTQRKGPR